MASNGRIITGFSKPYVATYSETGGTITYSGVTPLARGVSVALSIDDASSDNTFYADNVAAESIAGVFGGGTATFTVDGLLDATRKMILGLPVADTAGFYHYGDSMSVPYVGIGYVERVQAEGAVKYVPVIICKAKFKIPADNAATQEESVAWQTEELEATILRADNTNHDWMLRGGEESTEATAELAVKTALGYTAPNSD